MAATTTVPAGPGRRWGPALDAALAVQREVMERYGDQLEQLLGMLVFMVPIQEDADDAAGFWNQACYTATDLFGLYRTVLLRSPSALPVAVPASCPGGTALLQYKRLTYTVAAFVLRAIRATQVLLEMRWVQQYGRRWALRACLYLELLKLALKLWLRSRMPFAFYIDEEALEDAEPAVLPTAQGGSGADTVAVIRDELRQLSSEAFVGRRSGKTFRMPQLQAEDLCEDASRASRLLLVAEALFHVRPLVHLQLLLRRGHKSWATWFLVLLLERASVILLSVGMRPRPNTRAARLENAELQRRRARTWWALARSPAFERVLQRPCEVLDNVLKQIPIVNIFNVVEVALALQPFYFTTSGS